MTQTAIFPRNTVARTGFANPLTLAVLVESVDYLKVFADEDELTVGDDYSVTGLGSTSGVSIEIIGAEDVDEYVGVTTFTALFDPVLSQGSDLSLGGGIGRPFEAALDQQNRQLQAVAGTVQRAIKVPVNIDGDMSIVGPLIDGYVIAWSETDQCFYFTPPGATGPAGPTGPAGAVDTVAPGTGIAVDATDPANPVVALSSGALASLGKADTAVQPAGISDVLRTGNIGVSVQPYDAATTKNGATQTLTGKTLTDPVIIGAVKEDEHTITDGAAFEIDPSNGTIQRVTLGASRTPAATNFADGEGLLLMVNDGSAYAITWTTVGVVWVGGSAPALATTGWTHIVLWKTGGTIYGKLVGTSA